MFKSKKQTCVTRSSTTAELVGLSDMMQFALYFTEFLEGQGYASSPSILLQYNESIIKIVASNGKTLKYRHMRTKQADAKAITTANEAILEHVL